MFRFNRQCLTGIGFVAKDEAKRERIWQFFGFLWAILATLFTLVVWGRCQRSAVELVPTSSDGGSTPMALAKLPTAWQRQVGLQGKMDEVLQEFDLDEEILTHVLQAVGAEGAIVKNPKPEKTAETWGLPGFLGKARVTTSFGELPIEALRRRDKLRTITGEYLPVAWIDCVKLDRGFLRHHPNARPVEIPAGVLGHGTPKTEIWVSRQQKVQSSCFKRETTTVRLLLQRNGIRPRMSDHAEYYLFHCGKPAMVCVEGLWCLTEPQNDGT